MADPTSDDWTGGRRDVEEPSSVFARVWVRLREWVLLTGNRLTVSGLILGVVAVVVSATVATGVVPLEVREPILFILFALISGNFALITIVVSLNQFVLTRHLESPDEIRHRMDEMLGYRREVGESTRRAVLPITPSGFLMVLFYTITQQARDLERHVSDVDDDQAQDELHRLSQALEAHTSRVTDMLAGAPGGVQTALFTTLSTSYASYIYLAFHLDAEHAGSLDEETTTLLSDVVRSLEQVDVARRFFKTVFIQSQIASLSRLLLYIGLPVQLVTVVLMLAFTATVGAGPPRSMVVVAVPAIVIAGFAPFVILASFIVRLSTVAQRTAAMYPFTEEPEDIEPILRQHERPDSSGPGNRRRQVE